MKKYNKQKRLREIVYYKYFLELYPYQLVLVVTSLNNNNYSNLNLFRQQVDRTSQAYMTFLYDTKTRNDVYSPIIQFIHKLYSKNYKIKNNLLGGQLLIISSVRLVDSFTLFFYLKSFSIFSYPILLVNIDKIYSDVNNIYFFYYKFIHLFYDSFNIVGFPITTLNLIDKNPMISFSFYKINAFALYSIFINLYDNFIKCIKLLYISLNNYKSLK